MFSLSTPDYIALHSEFETFLKSKGYQLNTVQSMSSSLREFLWQMEAKNIDSIKQITSQHLQQHYSYLATRKNLRRSGGLSASMLNHHIKALRSFFTWLQHSGVFEIHPMAGLDFTKESSPPRVAISLTDIKKLYSVCSTLRDRAILGLYYGCGLRRSEGEDLNRKDINFSEQKLIVRSGKYNKRREVVIHPVVCHDLQRYYSEERSVYIKYHSEDNMNAFLLNNDGHRMRGKVANRHLKSLVKKAQLPSSISLHALRHSIATHLKDNGMPLEQIQQFLGHASMDTTQAYIEGYSIKYKHKNNFKYYART